MTMAPAVPSSSEDSLPVLRRKVIDDINSVEKMKRKRVAVLLDDTSSDDSSIPSWLRANKEESPEGPLDDAASKERETPENARKGDGAAENSGKKSTGTKATPMIYLLSSSSDSEDDVPLAARVPKNEDFDMTDLPQTQAPTTQEAPTQPTPKAKKKSPAKKPTSAAAAAGAATTATTATTAPTTTTTKTAMAPKKASPGAIPNNSNKLSVNVMVPDKLPRSKLLLELETTKDTIAGATDMSGDTGAIGRILQRSIATAGGESTVECHELDLKGRMYTVTPAQFPGTIMVLNFQGEDAKIEMITDSFVQLREDMRFRSDENEKAMQAWLEDDDDDDESGGPTAAKGGGRAKAKAKKPAAKKPAAKKPAAKRKVPAKKRAKK